MRVVLVSSCIRSVVLDTGNMISSAFRVSFCMSLINKIQLSP